MSWTLVVTYFILKINDLVIKFFHIMRLTVWYIYLSVVAHTVNIVMHSPPLLETHLCTCTLIMYELPILIFFLRIKWHGLWKLTCWCIEDHWLCHENSLLFLMRVKRPLWNPLFILRETNLSWTLVVTHFILKINDLVIKLFHIMRLTVWYIYLSVVAHILLFVQILDKCMI